MIQKGRQLNKQFLDFHVIKGQDAAIGQFLLKKLCDDILPNI